MKVNIIGAGLAGSEAAYQLLKRGYEVHLYEMRPTVTSPAHQTQHFAELVCSNSLRSNVITNAVGLLKEEMRLLDSLIMKSADLNKIEAGSALAVDRDLFSKTIEDTLKSFDNFFFHQEEVTEINPNEYTIVCSGPLTSEKLSNYIQGMCKEFKLHFFDAIAPIIEKDSINFDIAYRKSRYSDDEDYINCPMTKEEYFNFYHELINAQCAQLREFETLEVFEGCMPVEEMAKRGPKTLTFGPLKPVGLSKDQNHKPYAVVQLRQDNVADTLYNLVGFQTHLTFKEQQRIFRMIPGLENAVFARYGVMHRNTYLNSPNILNFGYEFKENPNIYFAGQMTGVEGYVESAGSGLVAAISLHLKLSNQIDIKFPIETMLGSMANYVVSASSKNFQPMNANFGILVSKEKRSKEEKVEKALSSIQEYAKLFK